MSERPPDLPQASEIAETWISAGFGISLIHKILEDEASSPQKRQLMFQLAHFQYATELAYSRLKDGVNTPNPRPGEVWSFAPLFARAADAHALLVHAAGYWKAFQELVRLLPFPDLVTLLEEIKEAIAATTLARNHMEHIAERIVAGRKPRPGTRELSAEDFQRAIGRLEFPCIVFGDESFDLAAIAGTVLSTGSRVAPALEKLFDTGTTRYFDAISPPTTGGDAA